MHRNLRVVSRKHKIASVHPCFQNGSNGPKRAVFVFALVMVHTLCVFMPSSSRFWVTLAFPGKFHSIRYSYPYVLAPTRFEALGHLKLFQRVIHPFKGRSSKLKRFLDASNPDVSPVYSAKVSASSQLKIKNVLSSLNCTLSTTPPSRSGLSKFHLSILSRTIERQRFMTGKYPIYLTINRNPTRKWLNIGRRVREDGSTPTDIEILINGTTLDRSLASIDRFHWIEIEERKKLEMLSFEFLAEINIEKPGYLQLLSSDTAGLSADLYFKSAAKMNNDSLENPFCSNEPLDNRITGVTSASMKDDSRVANERLWVTGFSLGSQQGTTASVDTRSCQVRSINEKSTKLMLWPNEVQNVPTRIITTPETSESLHERHLRNRAMGGSDPAHKEHQDALLVCDGFLLPTKDRGGLYIVRKPGDPLSESTIRLTAKNERWFYHRAVWIDLTGDGRLSILTARAKVSTILGSRRMDDGFVSSGIHKAGQLVMLECPMPTSYDPTTGTPLEEDGTVFDAFSSRHLPWKTNILTTGPDVMFCIADLDTTDDTIEVIASQFFGKKVVLYSIKKGLKPKVVFERVIDDTCGQAFGSILADLDGLNYFDRNSPSNLNRIVVDSGSTVPTLVGVDLFSHLLVTSHERSFHENVNSGRVSSEDTIRSFTESPASSSYNNMEEREGGKLFAYRVPDGRGAWKTKKWKRSTIATGFKVSGQLSNILYPGAPGFVYTFFPRKGDRNNKRPLIAVAGDCSESAYIFRPYEEDISQGIDRSDLSTKYKLMVEIACGATVGSIGIGYDDFGETYQETGYAKLYIPCYEKDKVLVFGLGSGED